MWNAISLVQDLNDNWSWERYPRGFVTTMMDYDIIVSEFELQSHYYVHFRTNTLGKEMNILIPPTQLWVK